MLHKWVNYLHLWVGRDALQLLLQLMYGWVMPIGNTFCMHSNKQLILMENLLALLFCTWESCFSGCNLLSMCCLAMVKGCHMHDCTCVVTNMLSTTDRQHDKADCQELQHKWMYSQKTYVDWHNMMITSWSTLATRLVCQLKCQLMMPHNTCDTYQNALPRCCVWHEC